MVSFCTAKGLLKNKVAVAPPKKNYRYLYILTLKLYCKSIKLEHMFQSYNVK